MSAGKLDLNKQSGETELAYINRVGGYKHDGLIDMTWNELADVFNKNLRDDGVAWNESTYRKKFANIRQFGEEFGYSTSSCDKDELVELRRQLEKEKIKVRDERNEYRKLIREEARKESYLEQFIRTIEETAGNFSLDADENRKVTNIDNEKSSMIIPLYDLHAGIEIDNFFNNYNSDILKKRLNHYLDRILEIKQRHKCMDAYVCCSELLSGIIHPTLRIQNNQDLIDQFIMVTDYICDFLAELAYNFEIVNVYVAPGNHSRINPKKEQDIAHENMDNLIIPFVRARMQQFSNVYCWDNDIEQSIALFSVHNINVAAIHGDKDPFETAADRINKFLRVRVDLIITGHKHTNQFRTSADVKCVQSGCLHGSDEYAINNRLRNRPEQAVCIITEKEGLDCIYDIKFY